MRKGARKQTLSYINVYEMEDDLTSFKVLSFDLEDNIIQYLAEIKEIDLRQTTDIYYHSRLAEQVSSGMYGIENMDFKYLVQDMIENENDLFSGN